MIYWLSFISVKELEEDRGLSHSLFYIPQRMMITRTPADTMSPCVPFFLGTFLERIQTCLLFILKKNSQEKNKYSSLKHEQKNISTDISTDLY